LPALCRVGILAAPTCPRARVTSQFVDLPEERHMQDDCSNIDLNGQISLAQYPDIREWCSHLGCTEIELAEAIAVVGYSPDLVRVFLAEKSKRNV
jgi:hypothetical protein